MPSIDINCISNSNPLALKNSLVFNTTSDSSETTFPAVSFLYFGSGITVYVRSLTFLHLFESAIRLRIEVESKPPLKSIVSLSFLTNRSTASLYVFTKISLYFLSDDNFSVDTCGFQ